MDKTHKTNKEIRAMSNCISFRYFCLYIIFEQNFYPTERFKTAVDDQTFFLARLKRFATYKTS